MPQDCQEGDVLEATFLNKRAQVLVGVMVVPSPRGPVTRERALATRSLAFATVVVGRARFTCRTRLSTAAACCSRRLSCVLLFPWRSRLGGPVGRRACSSSARAHDRRLTVFRVDGKLWVLLPAAVGVLSPSGHEVGPFLPIEQAALTHVVTDRNRTEVFAWYTLTGSLGTALGALSAGVITRVLQEAAISPVSSYRAVVILYAALGVVLAAVFAGLSHRTEPWRRDTMSRQGHQAVSRDRRSRGFVINCHLFARLVREVIRLQAFARTGSTYGLRRRRCAWRDLVLGQRLRVAPACSHHGCGAHRRSGMVFTHRRRTSG